MKISKKNLRKIILENILSEQENRTGGGATRVRSDDREGLLTKIEKIVKDAAADTNDLVEAIIRVGKDFITFSGVIVKEGASEKEVKKAVRDAINEAEDIEELRRKLRRGRSYKVTINRSGEVQAAETEAQSREASPAGADGDAAGGAGDDSPGVGTGGSGDPKIYEYDSVYDYKVNQQTGCWMARKRPNGSWFSMKRYPENMWNLDQKFQNARTDKQKEKCPNRKPTGSGSTNNTAGKLGETISGLVSGDMLGVTTSSRVANGALANDDGEQVAFVGSSGFDMVHEDLGGGALEGVDSGYVIVQKEKSGQPGPDNKTLAAAVIYITSSGVKGFYVDENLKKIGSISDESFTTSDFNSQGSPAGLGIDATIIKKILNNLKRFKQIMISESLSRGSLIRRRYWGRY